MKKKIKYIFSINTGRSGSHYLSILFKHAQQCKSFHEAKPKGNELAMRKFFKGDVSQIRAITEQKVKNIFKIVQNDKVYVETNHCFIKGFGWFISEFIPEDEIGIIHLMRNAEDIVDSMFRGGTSPITPIGRDWIMTPEIASPVIPPPSRLGSVKLIHHLFYMLKIPFKQYPYKRGMFYKKMGLSPPKTPKFIAKYEKECLRWYIEETNALADIYQQKFPKMKYIRVDVKDLNTLQGVKNIFDFFGIKEKKSIRKVIGYPTNLLKMVLY